MESYHPEHLLLYYKFLKNLNIWRTYSTSGVGLLQDPRFIAKSPWGPGGLSRECILRIPMRVVKGD